MLIVAELRYWLLNPEREDIVTFTLPVLEPLQASQLQKIVKSLGEALYAAEASYIEQQVDYFGFAAVLALSRVRWGLLGASAHCVGIEDMHWTTLAQAIKMLWILVACTKYSYE